MDVAHEGNMLRMTTKTGKEGVTMCEIERYDSKYVYSLYMSRLFIIKVTLVIAIHCGNVFD